jgi:hypothetical protein
MMMCTLVWSSSASTTLMTLGWPGACGGVWLRGVCVYGCARMCVRACVC